LIATIVVDEGPYMGSDDVSSVAFSSNRKMLASDSSDNSIKLLDVGFGKELRALVGHSKLERAGQSLPVPVAFSPDGKLLASGSGDRATLWDVASGKELRTLNLSFVVCLQPRQQNPGGR
jgi:WD40 repeat protein